MRRDYGDVRRGLLADRCFGVADAEVRRMTADVWAWTFAALFAATLVLLWIALKGNEELAGQLQRAWAENRRIRDENKRLRDEVRCLKAERYIVRWAENQDGAA